MRIDIMTLFPDMCRAVLDESIVGRARKAGKVEIEPIQRINTEMWTIHLTAAVWVW